MFILSDIGQLLRLLPRSDDGNNTPAGAPFELPDSLAVPDQQTDRWTFTPTTWPRANR